jgi:hypothetical protein
MKRIVELRGGCPLVQKNNDVTRGRTILFEFPFLSNFFGMKSLNEINN